MFALQPTLPITVNQTVGGDGAAGGRAPRTTGGLVAVSLEKNPGKKIGTATRRGGWWDACESVAFDISELEYFRRLKLAEAAAAKEGVSEKEFYREVMRKDLYFLRKVVLGHQREAGEDKLRWEYDKPGSDLAVDARFARQLWLEPRGWRKSSKLRAKMIQRILRNPNVALLYLTGVLDLATDGLTEIKAAFLDNALMRYYFPELCPDRDRDNMTTFMSPGRTQPQVEPTITAASTNTDLTGHHYDEIFGDDWISAKNCTTREQVKSTVDRLRLTFPLLRSQDGPMTVAGTRYDFGDVYGHMIETLSQEAGGSFFCVVQASETDDGQPAVPEVADAAALAEWRKLLGAEYSAQMLQRPQNEFQRITPEMFRYHNDTEVEIRASFLCLLTDAAYSKREGADFVALLVCAATPDGYWDVLEYTREHLDPRQFLNRLWHYWDKYKPLGGIQRIAVQSATLDQVLAFFLTEDMKARNEYLPLERISVAGQDKVKRIERAVTRLRMERLRMTRTMPELEDEFLRFPKSPHDDLTDALSDMAVVAPVRDLRPVPPPTPAVPIDFSFAAMWRGMSQRAHAAGGADNPNSIAASDDQLLGRVPAAAWSLC